MQVITKRDGGGRWEAREARGWKRRGDGGRYVGWTTGGRGFCSSLTVHNGTPTGKGEAAGRGQ